MPSQNHHGNTNRRRTKQRDTDGNARHKARLTRRHLIPDSALAARRSRTLLLAASIPIRTALAARICSAAIPCTGAATGTSRRHDNDTVCIDDGTCRKDTGRTRGLTVAANAAAARGIVCAADVEALGADVCTGSRGGGCSCGAAGGSDGGVGSSCAGRVVAA